MPVLLFAHIHRVPRTLLVLACLLLLSGGSALAATFTHIRVEPSSLTLAPSATHAYRAFAEYSDGSSVEITAFVEWTTGSSRYARVSTEADSRGHVTARAPGEVEIRATLVYGEDNIRGTALLTIDAGPLLRIRTRPTSKSLEVGEIELFDARAVFASGYEVDISERVLWSTSDASIASVVASGIDAGRVTAHATGLVAISADDLETGLRNTDGSTRVRARVTHIGFDQAGYLLGRDMRLSLRVYAYRTDGTRTNITDDTTFYASVDGVIAIQTGGEDAGLIHGLAEGSVEVDAHDTERDLWASAGLGRTTIRVTGELAEIVVTPLTLSIGETRNARVYGVLTTGERTDDLRKVVDWTSADEQVAQVGNGNRNGEVIGVGAGRTTLFAYDPHTGIASNGTSNVRVRGAVVALAIDAPDGGRVPMGTAVTFKARARYEEGDTSNVSDKCDWSIDHPNVAEVDNMLPGKGAITGLEFGGRTTVRILCNGLSASAEVRVIGDAIALRISPDGGTFAAFRNKKFRAWVQHEGGDEIDITGETTWISANPGVAFPDPEEPGRIHFLDSGEAQIAAVAPNGFVATATLVVQGGILTMEITPDKATIRGGSGRRLRVTATMEDGKTRRTVTRSVTLTSSDDEIVRIAPTDSEPGRILAGSMAGTAIVTARTTSGIEATATIRVRGILQALEVRLHRDEIESGKDVRVRIRGFYETGKPRFLSRYAELRSSDENVARPGRGLRRYGRLETGTPGTAEIYAIDTATGIQSPPITLKVLPAD
ncbi:MAG: Ig-like domain-containing protein [Deltaproteobacteria bacterium]